MSTCCILIVHPDFELRHSLAQILNRQGHQTFGTPDATGARRIVLMHALDVVLCAAALPEEPGVERLREVQQLQPNAVRVLATQGFGGLDSAPTDVVHQLLTLPLAQRTRLFASPTNSVRIIRSTTGPALLR